jgi:AraC-like DNA-binding protein
MNLKNVVGITVKHSQLREQERSFHSLQEPLKASNLLFINKGVGQFQLKEHSFAAQKDELIAWQDNEMADFMHAQGQPVSFHALVVDIIGKDGTMVSLSDIDFPRRLRFRKPGQARKLFTKINDLFHSRHPLRLLHCSQLCLELFDWMNGATLSPLPQSASETGPLIHHRIRDALETIYVHYKKRLTVADLAKEANMSTDYFSQVFTRQVGISPARYIMEFKIRKAMDFLGTFDEPLVFTSEELGFHDYSHFSRTFKKVTGMSPREFIQKKGKGYDPKQDEWNL